MPRRTNTGKSKVMRKGPPPVVPLRKIESVSTMGPGGIGSVTSPPPRTRTTAGNTQVMLPKPKPVTAPKKKIAEAVTKPKKKSEKRKKEGAYDPNAPAKLREKALNQAAKRRRARRAAAQRKRKPKPESPVRKVSSTEKPPKAP